MGSYDQDVDAAIRATAARAGMSPAEWKAIASIESGVNPQSNIAAGTQYKGLYQVGGNEWATHGSGNIYNPMDNARAAAELAAHNNATFTAHFGRAPTPIETYMMHQQGPGFYTSGSLTNVAGNLPTRDQTPENMTHNGLQAYYARKMAGLANQFRDPNDPNEISYSGADVGASRGSVPAGATAQAGGSPSSTEASADDTGDAEDYASQMQAIGQKIAKQNEANAPPPLQPMAPLQPMVTPAMLRARQLAQAMMNLQSGGGATPPSGSATS